MNEALASSDLAELLIHGFELMTPKERLSYCGKLQIERSVKGPEWALSCASFVYSLEELSCWHFFKKKLTDGTFLLLYHSSVVENRTSFWHLVVAPDGIPKSGVHHANSVIEVLSFVEKTHALA